MGNAFTEENFFDEIRQFRAKMGTKEWWAGPDAQREAWIRSLTIVYLNIKNVDGSKPTQQNINLWANILESTLTEYQRRKTMIALLPPPPKTEAPKPPVVKKCRCHYGHPGITGPWDDMPH
jgi:hypothetical protein